MLKSQRTRKKTTCTHLEVETDFNLFITTFLGNKLSLIHLQK